MEIIESMENVIFDIADNLRSQTTVTRSDNFMKIIVDRTMLDEKHTASLTLIVFDEENQQLPCRGTF